MSSSVYRLWPFRADNLGSLKNALQSPLRKFRRILPQLDAFLTFLSYLEIMNIQQKLYNTSVNPQRSPIQDKGAVQESAASLDSTAVVDHYVPDAEHYASPSSKALGTIFAGAGATLGRLAVPAGGGWAGAALGSLALGPVGAVALGAVGVAAGIYSEFKNLRYEGLLPAGRMVGGMLGGTIGTALGKVLDTFNIDITSDKMKKEMKGFSLKKLWSRVKDVSYTSHNAISSEQVQDIKNSMKPGDVVVTSHDNFMDIEIPSALMGMDGAWSHTAIYVGDGKVVEGLGNETQKIVERSVEDSIGINHHVRVLRPNYQEGQGEAAAQKAKDFVGKPWEMAYNLESDEALGCIEVVYKAIKRTAPQMDIQAHSIFGKEFLTHKVFNDSSDMKVVKDTGSSFLYNYLSKFN